MARVVFAIATVLLVAMTAIASAQSYKSRGYGGPLNVGPNFKEGGQYTPPSYGPKSSTKKRYKKRRVDRADKKRKSPAKKEVDTAKAAPVDKGVERENSSISSLGGDTDETSAPKKTESAKGPQSENSTISYAEAGKDDGVESPAVAKGDDEPKRANVGCKKYFPSAGMTLSVPCD